MSTDDTTARPAPSPAEATSALEHAARLAASTRTRGWRWVRLYLSGWAAASVGLVLALGLGGRIGFVVGMSAWAVIVTAGVTWAARQGSMAAGTRRRLVFGAGSWALVYGATLFVGLDRFAGDVTFWVPAALVSAVPLLLAAWLPAPRDAAATA
jgi:hypothetical protein